MLTVNTYRRLLLVLDDQHIVVTKVRMPAWLCPTDAAENRSLTFYGIPFEIVR